MALELEIQQLMQEPLAADEVRVLLERLGEHEFAPPDVATLAAVVEATGAEPLKVAQLLSDIRGQTFQARLQVVLERQQAFMEQQRWVDGHQDSRLSSLERRSMAMEPPRLRLPPVPEAERTMSQSHSPEFSETAGVLNTWALGLFVIAVLVVLGMIRSSMVPPSDPWPDPFSQESPFGTPSRGPWPSPDGRIEQMRSVPSDVFEQNYPSRFK